MGTYYTIHLNAIAKKETKGKYADLVTRQIGRAIFSRLEREIQNVGAGAIIVLDFSGIGAIDYSCADEIFARLIMRLQQNEYGEKYIVFTGLSEHHQENIHIVLEKKDLAVLVKKRDGWEVVGSLDNYLLQTLQNVMGRGRLSSSQLSEKLDLALNTASMRLLNLSKLRLVKKNGAVNQWGKRCFVYTSILNAKN